MLRVPTTHYTRVVSTLSSGGTDRTWSTLGYANGSFLVCGSPATKILPLPVFLSGLACVSPATKILPLPVFLPGLACGSPVTKIVSLPVFLSGLTCDSPATKIAPLPVFLPGRNRTYLTT